MRSTDSQTEVNVGTRAEVHLPVQVGSSCVLVGQLEPRIRHHLVNIGTLVGIRLKKLLQETDGG